MSPNKENNCLFIPLKTGVYAIIAIGILNKLSGLYGLLFLRYQSTSIVISHLYSVVGLVFFAFGLYGVSKDHRSVFKVYLVFYWVDLLINTAATTYFSIQVFGEYSRSQIDLLSDRQQILEHNKESKSDCNTVLIVLACIKITQVYFAYLVTQYCKSMGKTKYSEVTLQVDEELGFTEIKKVIQLK